MSEPNNVTSEEKTSEVTVPLTQKASSKLQMLTYTSMAIALIAVAYAAWVLLKVDTSYESGHNEGSVEWLPREASAISYFRGKNILACECSMQEKDFIKWAKDWKPEEITSNIQLERYNYFIHKEKNPTLEHKMSAEDKEKYFVLVSKGYICYFRGAGEVKKIVYNQKTQRVYILTLKKQKTASATKK